MLLRTLVWAQGEADKPAIQLTGFVESNRILLRWAPTGHVGWLQANRAGYTLYRKTVIRDGRVVSDADSVLVGTYRPLPLESWEPFADSSTFAIAAEALYGSGMELTVTAQNSFFDRVTVARDQQNRFSIGLLCADRSFTAACMMGLGATDTNIRPNEAYLYTVYSNHTDSLTGRAAGSVLVDPAFGNMLPRPFGINYSLSGSTVSLSLPYDPFRGIYSNFELERSTDGKHFTPVSGKAYRYMTTVEEDVANFWVNDTVPQVASTIYYRLRGITPFDTYGPYSETITVRVKPSLGASPWITDIRKVDGSVAISWSMDSVPTDNLKGFMVYESANHNGPFKPVLNELLGRAAGRCLVQAPSDYAYYRVAAVDRFNRPYFSRSRLFQAIDSVPPKPPTGLRGSFDTTGVATINWHPGPEPDLLCYQLLYSVIPTGEFSPVTGSLIYDTTYAAKFPLNMLSGNLYFRVVAMDTRYNTSKPSEPVLLVKPDTLPPAAPALELSADSLGNTLVSIYPSRSVDVVKHTLYLEQNGEVTIPLYSGTLRADTSLLLSSTIGSGTLYCVAVDCTGRRAVSGRYAVHGAGSTPGNPFRITYRASYDAGWVELSWTPGSQDGIAMVYRKEANGAYRLLGTVDLADRGYRDATVRLNTSYTYRVICVSPSNTTSYELSVRY